MTDDSTDPLDNDDRTASADSNDRTDSVGSDDRTADGDRPTDDDNVRSHEFQWRCTGCKALYDEEPERCERCGATEFRRHREV